MDRGDLDQRERAALLASTVALVALVVAQAPGRIVPETKLAVVLDPAAFLARALHAWDPSAGLGRIQNQAVGYLFPMGPAHLVGRWLGLEPWLVQRLWIAAVLVLALWGAHRVARAIGISTAGGRLVAAWAYALAPAALGVAAFQSAGQLPYALAPHVLAPLLVARPGASPRRVAARSTLWLAAMGGVNGASSFAVLPLVALWFLTRSPGPDRRRLLAWWSGGAVAATLWWFLPLVVAVRYGVRFTDYTEQASLTTATTSATEVLRGTDNWIGYLASPVGPWLPGAWELAVARVAVLGSALVAALGLAGLVRRDHPERSWLLLCAGLGAVAIGAGYGGPWSGAASGLVRDLLDGPLVVFRNVHKFAAVLRLPVALGLGHLVAVAARQLADPERRANLPRPARRTPTLAPSLLGLGVVVLAVVPALPRLTAPGPFEDLPAHWRQTAAWLDDADASGVLVLPGAAFAEQRWGRSLDEPLSALGTGRWATRDLIPLGGNGSTRLLDGIDEALRRGSPPPGLLAALQRTGTSHLVVRNDLELLRTGGPRPATVRHVLEQVEGLELVASFGEATGDRGADGELATPPGSAGAAAYRQVDIWAVPDPEPRLAAHPVDGAVVVTGGPEGLLDLPAEVLDGRAAVLDVDLEPGALGDRAVVVATDSARRRDVAFGAIRDNVTVTLGPDDASPATGRAPVDRWPADEPVGLATARLEGAAALLDSNVPNGIHPPELAPFAAFDGDPTTVWSAELGDEGEWLEVRFDEPRTIDRLRAALPRTEGRRVGTVDVRTDGGSVRATFDDEGELDVELPDGPTDRIRIEVAELTGRAIVGPVGIAEVELDGVQLRRPIVLAERQATGGEPEVVSLARARRSPSTAGRDDEDGTLDRVLRWAGGPARLTGTGTVRPGPGLDAALEAATTPAAAGSVRAEASSTFRGLPGLDPTAVLDLDPTSGWVSEREAGVPELELAWDGPVLVDALRVRPLEVPGAGLDRVREVEVVSEGERYRRSLELDGSFTIPTTFTDRLVLRFPHADVRRPLGGRRVGIATVEVPALVGRGAATAAGRTPPDRTATIALPCGDGPTVTVDGEQVPTRADALVADLVDGRPVPWEACDVLDLAAGEHRLVAPSADDRAVRADTALLVPADGLPAVGAPGRDVRVERWADDVRRAEVGGGDAAILATTENANDGWEARLDGELLTPVRVDGWRQGWIVPAGGAGELELRYAPDRVHRGGLLLGAALVLALALAAAIPSRRRGWTPPAARAVGPRTALALAVAVVLALLAPVPAALVLLGGWAGWRLGWIVRPALVVAALGLGAGAVAVAIPIGGIAGVATGGGTFTGPAQLLAAAALGVAMGSLAVGSGAGAVSPAAGSTRSSRDRSGPTGPDTGTTPAGSG